MVELIHKEIIASAYEVARILGYGFLEKVYENALKVELQLRKLDVESQRQVIVSYKGSDVGLYQIDLLVNEKVLVEVKSMEAISQAHRAQIINYLKATGVEVGLIINFGKTKVEFERLINN